MKINQVLVFSDKMETILLRITGIELILRVRYNLYDNLNHLLSNILCF